MSQPLRQNDAGRAPSRADGAERPFVAPFFPATGRYRFAVVLLAEGGHDLVDEPALFVMSEGA